MVKAQLLRVYRACRRWSYSRYESSRTPFHVSSQNQSFLIYPEGQIARELYVNRFERRERNAIIDVLRPGMCVVDIGANIGLYSLLAAKCVGPDGKVWSFEPSTETFARLRRNLQLNNLDSVQTVQTALTDRHGGFLTLRRAAGDLDGMRYLDDRSGHQSSAGNPAKTSPTAAAILDAPPNAEQTPSEDAGDTESVPITTIDRFVEDNNIDRIDFLKMDVEGHEFSVFRGAENTLRKNQDLLMMVEITAHQQETFDFLRSMGFRLYVRDGAKKQWDTDDASMIRLGNVWACRHESRLPPLR